MSLNADRTNQSSTLMSQKRTYSIICAAIVLTTAVAFYWRVTWHSMPGQTFNGPLPPLSEKEVTIRDALAKHVHVLAEDIGERNSTQFEHLNKAAEYIIQEFKIIGYQPRFQAYELNGKTYKNIEVEIAGKDPNAAILIVGAHYDSALNSPGADDNASGVASLLELSRALWGKQFDRKIKIVAFANGEPPYANTPDSGSHRYAQLAKGYGAKIKGMISLDELGYYSDSPESEKLPVNIFSYYPAVGDFVMAVGNAESASFCRGAVESFRNSTKFPSEGIICRDSVNPQGMEGVDHVEFWKAGYPAVMFTDTGADRDPVIHSAEDVSSRVDADRLCRVTGGLVAVLMSLASN
ncbi:MAG: M28 family peptidase [Candidatus Melainabacteria bacterium]|nr:MAG: M28 family peptidase [Candidatus Melainabacteria bacterium]